MDQKPKEKAPEQEKKPAKKQFSVFSKLFINAEKEYVLENLCTLMASGMTINTALESIKVEIRSPYLRSLLDTVQEEIDSGSTLWQALERTRLFSEHIISLIRTGEESGRLSENLDVISVYERKEHEFRSKLASALIYPVIVFIITIIVAISIAWFSLPKLAEVFTQLRIELPLMTKILIGLGLFLGDYGFFVVPLVIIFIFIISYFVFFHKATKKLGQQLIFAMPIFRKLIQQVELSRMGYIVGNLLEAGLPVASAIDSLSRSTDFYLYKDLYKHLNDSIIDGNSFQDSLSHYKNSKNLVPGPVQQLIVAGEQSGQLSKVFIKIGSIYESKSDTYMKNLPVILEPILLVIVWIGVVAVAVAIILPLYSLIGNLNN